MDGRVFAAKFLNTVADSAAGGAVGVLAAAHPLGATITVGALAAGLLAQAFIQSNGDAEAQRQGQAALRELIQSQGGIVAALRRIASEQDAGQIFAGEQARQILNLLETRHSETSENLGRHESLLIHIGQWLSDWCAEQRLSQEQLIDSVREAIDANSHKIEEVRDFLVEERERNVRTWAENNAAHLETQRRLADLNTSVRRLPEVDGHAQIEKAVEHLKRRAFDVADYILSELRSRHWPSLTPREQFRVLANLGHIVERRDGDYHGAARLYFEAADADPSHERTLSLRAAGHLLVDDRPRARDVALLAVAATPNGTLAHAVNIRATPDEVPFAEVEEAVPGHLREDAEVAFALAMRALMHAGSMDARGESLPELAAAERYMRAALSAEPGPLAQAHLGMIIIEAERRRAIGHTLEAVVHDRERLMEGIELLSSALGQFGKNPDPHLHARIHLARGIAYALLGDGVKADADFETAYGAAPEDPAIVFQQSLILHDRQDVDAAIGMLRRSAGATSPMLSRLMLCRMLARRNRDGDREEAIALLRAIVPTLTRRDDFLGIQVVETLVGLLGRRGDHDAALAAIATVPPGGVHPAALRAIAAHAEHAARRSEEAGVLAAEAVNRLADDASSEVKLYVAAAALRLNRPDLAFPVLRAVVPDDRIVAEAHWLVAAAEAVGEDGFVLEFCGRLRAKGLWEWAFISHEAQLLQHYHATNQAVAVLQQFLAATDDARAAKLARALLSDLGIRSGRLDLLVGDIGSLPTVDEAGPDWGEVTARVLRQTDPTAAHLYAYQLVRRFFGSPAAHRALVASMLPDVGPRVRLPVVTVAGADCAVRYRERGRSEDEWWVIETEPNPDLGRREIPPGHPIAISLSGKRPGGGPDSEFFIDRNGIQDRIGEVLEVVDKHVYRLRDSAEHYRERFPTEPFFIVTVRAVKPDGTPDVEPIFRFVDERDAGIREAVDQWRTHRPPVATLATALHRPIVDVVGFLSGRRGLRKVCCIGGLDELKSASDALAQAETVVLDPTALSSLFLSGAYRNIKAGPLRLLAAAGAVAEFRRLSEDEQPMPGMARGWLGVDGGKRVWQVADPAMQQRAAEELSGFLGWLSDNVQVVDGVILAQLPRSTRVALVENVGPATAESLLHSQRPGHMLWTDDAALVSAARASNFNVIGAWSQVAVDDLVRRGQADEVAVDKLATWLIQAGFFFLRVSADGIVRAAQEAAWNPAAEPLRTNIAVFAVPETEPWGLGYFLASTIARVIVQAPKLDKALDVVFALLDAVSVGPAGRILVQRLAISPLMFWPNIHVMLTAELALSRWLTRRRVFG